MRIVAGSLRGRRLVAPAGQTTRPTGERLRQAVFDMLTHAPWGGRALLDGALVLDLFAGTGALGLEALSRGAGRAEFFENDRAALAALHTNIAACGVQDRALVVAGDATRPAQGAAAGLVFLDPPYGLGLVNRTLRALREAGRVDGMSVIVAEVAREEAAPVLAAVLAERAHGAGRVVMGRQ